MTVAKPKPPSINYGLRHTLFLEAINFFRSEKKKVVENLLERLINCAYVS